MLFRSEVREQRPTKQEENDIIESIATQLDISQKDAHYLVTLHPVSAYTYRPKEDSIKVLYSNGELKDIVDASDILNLTMLSKYEKKYYFGWVKGVSIDHKE